MTPEQVEKMLMSLQRIAAALESLAQRLAEAPPDSNTHIVEQPLTFNLPRTERTHR